MEERQRILTSVQGVAGVANVVDNMQLVTQDMAFTDADRALLAQIRQTIPMSPTPTTTSGMLFFVLQQAAVTIVGQVPTVQEGERVIAVIRQTPGVAQVFEALTIGAGFTVPTATPPTGP